MDFLFNFSGFLTSLPLLYTIIAAVLIISIFGYNTAPLWLWTFSGYVFMAGLASPEWLWIGYTVIAVILNIAFIRRIVLTTPVIKLMKALNFLPVISETERIAIEAGDVWVDGDLFSGKPNINKLMKEDYNDLSEEETAFLNDQTEKLCAMSSESEIFKTRNLSKEAWDYIKKEKFWGLVIPKKYGGLEFSAQANSAIITKIASRSNPLTVTVMVPNSLGPAELLVHYGTEEQKSYYLPRLAIGEEIPCFALTEPTAGSDAGAMKATGEVFKGDDGILYIKLNWNKRYITLAAIATILGLAFKLHDPENLLGRGKHPGITCALIPTKTAGVVIGRRHDPLGVPFYNCPTQGKDVIIPVSSIIGGEKEAGNGWRMLMESLAAGRGISLPEIGRASCRERV